MKVLTFIILLISFSCAQKSEFKNNASEDIYFNFFEQKFSELKKSSPKLKIDGEEKVGNKDYYVVNIKNPDRSTSQLLIDKNTDIIEEVLMLDRAIFTNVNLNEYSQTYKPKCKNKSTNIKYNLDKKIIAYVQDEKLLFKGKSNVISDRLADDKNQKCINSWGH